MAEISNFLENELIDHVLRNAAYSSPATVHLALFTDDPTDADSGTEIATGSYARVAITFSAPANGVTSNSGLLTFPTATADWGTITHVGIYDAATNGNLLFHSILDQSKIINTDDVFKVNATDLSVTLA